MDGIIVQLRRIGLQSHCGNDSFYEAATFPIHRCFFSFCEALKFCIKSILGKTIYIWMIICIGIMVVRPFVLRPVLYNSYVSAFLAGPSISDDMTWVRIFCKCKKTVMKMAMNWMVLYGIEAV